MKRLIIMLAAAALVNLLPSQGTEVSTLLPAAVLVVQADEKSVHVRTDAGEAGEGETLTLALNNMREMAPGVVLLETVENLIITDSARTLLDDLRQELRPGVRVCIAEEELDAEAAWKYLRIHVPKSKLWEITEKSKLPILKCKEGRFILEDGG